MLVVDKPFRECLRAHTYATQFRPGVTWVPHWVQRGEIGPTPSSLMKNVIGFSDALVVLSGLVGQDRRLAFTVDGWYCGNSH